MDYFKHSAEQLLFWKKCST